jgi:hypothetical protein
MTGVQQNSQDDDGYDEEARCSDENSFFIPR